MLDWLCGDYCCFLQSAGLRLCRPDVGAMAVAVIRMPDGVVPTDRISRLMASGTGISDEPCCCNLAKSILGVSA